jgi:hypothetical protein
MLPAPIPGKQLTRIVSYVDKGMEWVEQKAGQVQEKIESIWLGPFPCRCRRVPCTQWFKDLIVYQVAELGA